MAAAYEAAGTRYGAVLTRQIINERFASAYATVDWSGPTNAAIEQHRWQLVVGSVFADQDVDQARLFDDLWGHFQDAGNWHLFPDVAPVWSYLEEQGFIVGIASNFDDRLLCLVQALPPLSHARHVLCSASIGWGKPHTNFYKAAEQRLHLQPSEILLVGDDPIRDFAAPRKRGWRALHLDRHESASGGESLHSLTELIEHPWLR